MTNETSPENKNAPLGLPEGSIRAILAIIIVLGGLILFGLSKLKFQELMMLCTAPVTLYFGQYIKSP